MANLLAMTDEALREFAASTEYTSNNYGEIAAELNRRTMEKAAEATGKLTTRITWAAIASAGTAVVSAAAAVLALLRP